MEAKVQDDLPRATGPMSPSGSASAPWPGAARSASTAATTVPCCATSPSWKRRCGLPGTVVDGEVVVVRGDRLDFDALQNRLHPAASRTARLARETPATLVAFDLLADRGEDRRPSLRRTAAAPGGPGRRPARPLDADPLHHRPWRGRPLVPRVRGCRVRRHSGQAPGRRLCGRQAGDGQGQAPPHRGLRGGRLPDARRRVGPAPSCSASTTRPGACTSSGTAPASRTRTGPPWRRSSTASAPPTSSGPGARCGGPAWRAGGRRGKTCCGSRWSREWWPRCPTTNLPGVASATPPASSGGVPTRTLPPAPWTSWSARRARLLLHGGREPVAADPPSNRESPKGRTMRARIGPRRWRPYWL